VAAAARKKTLYRAAALAALQKLLAAMELQPGGPSGTSQKVDSSENSSNSTAAAAAAAAAAEIVWRVASAPLLDALQQHVTAATSTPAAAEKGAEGADVAGSGEDKPAPLAETCM
jgi:hypothetical protein